MKIKCPACQTVLSVPDTAAGKVVKCKCGKQLRAPAAKPAAASAGPATTAPAGRSGATSRSAAARPTPQRPAASGGELDPDLFDDLTDKDLQPVNVVGQPRHASPEAVPKKTRNLLQQYAPPGEGGFRSGNRPIAGVGARIAGALLDVFFQALGIGVMIGLMFATGAMEEGEPDTVALIGICVGVVAALIPPIVNIVLISMSGQSLGKKLMGTMMIVEATGEPAKFVQGLLVRQFAFGFITGLPIVGGFIAIADVIFLFTEEHKTLHDRLAGTIVVSIR